MRAAAVGPLPSGALAVRNPEQGVWDSAATWRIREELRIGSADADGPEMFGDVADVAVDSTGRLWVLDSQAQEVLDDKLQLGELSRDAYDRFRQDLILRPRR